MWARDRRERGLIAGARLGAIARAALASLSSVAFSSVAFSSACGGATEPTPKPMPTTAETPPESARAVSFSFADLDGKEVSSSTVRGRITVVALIATYDAASQAEARFLLEVAKTHAPRINVVGVVLESPENEPLAEAFRGALDLPFPLCMADEAIIRGEGPFGGLNVIPSLLILDKEGRERYRHVGVLKKDELEDALRRVEGPAR
jgi:peroxiredoxin